MNRRIRKFTEIAKRLLSTSSLLAGEDVHLLINPLSGGFRRCRTHRRMMRKLRRLPDSNPSRLVQSGSFIGNRSEIDSANEIGGKGGGRSPKLHFHETNSPNEACNLALKIVRTSAQSRDERLRLMILLGGDGFHRDVCSVLIRQVPHLLQNFILFRMPMGTGNDSADARTLEEALRILNTARSTKKDSIIEIETNTNAIYHACNTVCFGLDAFVCLLTNKMKKLIPSTSVYRFFADVAVLFYELFYPLKEWIITIFNSDACIEKRRGRYLLNIFGRRGHTTYGGGMKVLPGRENYLLAQPQSLLEKLRLKPLFYRGAHRHLPTMEFFLCDRVEMNYDGSILMALDGEVVPLRIEDFPLMIKKIPDALTILN